MPDLVLTDSNNRMVLTLAPLLRGQSAYEVAVANGFVGTEADWVASLHGDAATAGAAAGAAAGTPAGAAAGTTAGAAAGTAAGTAAAQPLLDQMRTLFNRIYLGV